MGQLADEIRALAREVESEAAIAARPGQLDRLESIASRMQTLAESAHLMEESERALARLAGRGRG